MLIERCAKDTTEGYRTSACRIVYLCTVTPSHGKLLGLHENESQLSVVLGLYNWRVLGFNYGFVFLVIYWLFLFGCQQ